MDFPFVEYQAMADTMSRLKGKALLSINDHPAIREVFTGLYMEEVEIYYVVGTVPHRGAN